MTCREKLKVQHPELVDSRFMGGCRGCPYDVGRRYVSKAACSEICMDLTLLPSERCTKCWDQVIPSKKKTIKETKKGNETTMKKTKEELINENAELKKQIRKNEKELVKLERYRQYSDAAGELRAAHESFVEAGFTDEQAFELLKLTVSKLHI